MTPYSLFAVFEISTASPGSCSPKSFDGTPIIISPRWWKRVQSLLQAGVLRRVATERCGVHDEDRLAGKVGEADIAAAEAGEGEGVGGDAGHGGSLCQGRGDEAAGEQAQKCRRSVIGHLMGIRV